MAAAAAAAAFDADAALAAAAATMGGYVDVGVSPLWQAADKTTAADADGDPVRAIEPDPASGFGWLFDFSGTGLADFHTEGFSGIDLPVLEFPNANNPAVAPTDNGTNLKALSFHLATKYFGVLQIQVAANAGTGAVVMLKESSASVCMVEVTPTSSVGKYRVSVALDLATGSVDRTTITKEINHGATVALFYFWDGTDLHWQFLGDAAQTAEAFAGQLDPVGAGNFGWVGGNGGTIGVTLWKRWGQGHTAADNAAQLQILKDWLTAVAEKMAA